ncbi:MAG: Rieske 2Fe-2S domain-containing protein [Alphaproteobacteria bacterium]|nr:Rieske 2Fe-2S domain-containing protein [Alphaproteobacteria bacterium]
MPVTVSEPPASRADAADEVGMWVEALEASELDAKGRVLIKRGGKQIALFATPRGPRAIANRCPHEGYPLSEGTFTEGGTVCTLTCNWHNWKFDLETGAEAGGGDPVRTYPIRVVKGMIQLDLTDPPPEVRIERALASLKASFKRYDYDRIARDVARIQQAGGDPRDAVRAAIDWTHDKFEWGMTHALAAAPDWLAVYERAENDPDRVAAISEILGHLCWDSLRMPSFPFAEGMLPWAEDAFVAAVEAEDEDTATKLLRDGLRIGGWDRIDRGLARAALAHYQDFGHSAIYVEKSREAVQRLGTAAELPYALACLRALVTARREDLIPEFKGYHPARKAWTGTGSARAKPADFCRVSVTKALDRVLAASGNISALYDAMLEAAAWQLVRADPTYATRPDQPISQNVNRLDFSHAITFANAGRRIAERHPDLWPDVLLQIACFLGRSGGFVDPARETAPWRVADQIGFLEVTARDIVDHGNTEYIVSAHLVKMTYAVREEVLLRPEAPWVPALVAALNRFLNEPFTRKLTRRTAYQALKTVEGE